MKINKIISLGPNCHTAGILKKLKLKNESYPFDWILTNIKIIIETLENNFVDYLDKENYYINSNTVGHKKYHSQMFVHRNPFFDNDYKYLQRCVNRFLSLPKHTNILFVFTIYNNNFEINDFNKLFNVLKIKYINCNLLIINYNKSSENINQYIKEVINEKIIKININIDYDENIEYNIDKNIIKFYDIINPYNDIYDIEL